MQLSQFTSQQKLDYLNYLYGFITDQRRNKIEEVALNRTRFITVVIENIYQPHNASAVLRSGDCFGILDVHIIENDNLYQVNPGVALGSQQWLNMHIHNQTDHNTVSCLNKLKKDGYRIVATTPLQNDVFVDELPLDQKIALVFGNELKGLSDDAIEMADAFVKILMYGFTESLNISVSAAICMYSLMDRIRNSTTHWRLSEEESLDTRIIWTKNSIKTPDMIEKEYLKRFDKTE